MDIENIRLDSKDIQIFLKKIGVEKNTNQLLFLNKIIKGILTNIPYHNLYLLNARGTPLTIDKIISDMISGYGGLCDSQNPFLFILLKSLNFDVHLLSATMTQENCHIFLRVTIEDEYYCVDVGNGYPYFEAMSLQKSRLFKHPFMSHKVVKNAEKYSVCHKNKRQRWASDYEFYNKPVSYISFKNMLKKQYNNVGWGPFLDGLRVIKWTNKGALMIRDQLLWCSEKKLRIRINNALEFKKYLHEYFLLKPLTKEIDIDCIWNIWRQNNEKNY